jgi:autoinducer 2-degrading protein
MHISIVHVHVKHAHINDFIEACRRNHEAAIDEPGNRRFDVMQSAHKPGWFVLYEAYASAEAAAAHKQTPHYIEWRDSVATWMDAPRKALHFNGLFPA